MNWAHYNQLTLTNFKFLTNAVNDVYTINPKWNAVNLELGQDVLISEKSNLRIQGGIQYAQIRSAYNNSGLAPAGRAGTEYLRTGYDGIGPRIGADLAYNVINDLALYAKGATAIDVGNGSFSHGTTYPTTPRYASGTKSLVVPEVELKLGAGYNRAIMQGNLSVDIGYMFVNYFNVLINNNTGAETNFALSGPFVGAKWLGNV